MSVHLTPTSRQERQQSLISVFIFNGIGLGFFRQVERTTQVLIMVGIWVLQFV